MANRLAAESSPYLLEHRDNPVDWYPWDPEALGRAQEEGRPILLSVGYSACHWCRVMAEESFEDADTAAYMNRHFVCVKIDREERPDIDAIYTDACHAMTGRAGWPLTVFLTPAQVPFYAGTYFPPRPRGGLPAFRTVLEKVVEAWTQRRFQIDLGAERIAGRLGGGATLVPAPSEPDARAAAEARERLAEHFDAEHGGFGRAPKFPPASVLEWLLGCGETAMSGRTLRAMAAGGIYDQIGGGFARYAVDAGWAVPHFEKMLYDNALLARAYLHGWQVLGEERLREVACETLDWALRELRGAEGGFCASLAADSDGGEGRFYVWRMDELRAVLGADARDAARWFGAAEQGTFEGANVLVRAPGHAPDPERLADVRRRLLTARAERPRPARDAKRLTAWNALMVAALADVGAVLERSDYVAAARACADFLLAELRAPDGRVLRSWTEAGAHRSGFLDDHAYLVEALVVLYEATFDPRYFTAAREVADVMIAHFADEANGGFYETADDHERLLARRKDLADTPTPAGNSSAALGLLRLAALSGERAYERRAAGVLRLVGERAVAHPVVFAHALQALEFLHAPVREVALVGDDTAELERVVRSAFRPRLVLSGGEPDGVALLGGRATVGGRPAAYVCEDFTCQRPVTDPEELRALL